MKKSKFLFFISMFCVLYATSQTITIDSTFTGDDVIYPFQQNDTIYGISINGQATLNSDSSLVRVVYTDNSGRELMVYESYPLITDSLVESMDHRQDETAYFTLSEPGSVIIQIIDASLYIDKFDLIDVSEPEAEYLQLREKQELDQQKISMINHNIIDRHWFAGENGLTELFYQQKKEIFGDKYNIFGYDYYKEGIFSFPWQSIESTTSSAFVKHFNWRSRHSANVPNTPYFDNDDSTYTGWMTSVKSQGLSSDCWAFSTIGPVEANANLYFNQHIDYDLSEQDIVDNSGGGTMHDPEVALNFVRTNGVVTEYCFPYQTSTKCANPDTLVKISNVVEIDLPSFSQDRAIDSLKKAIITRGPLSLTIPQLNHAVTLMGFATTQNDEVYWIYKDSQGPSFGDNGFLYIYLDPVSHNRPVAASVPVMVLADSIPEILCRDEDGDGYYNWGTGPKPASCPTCPDLEDCDDSNPNLGPFDTDFSCGCLLEHSSDTLFVASDTTWGDDITQVRDIVVNNGVILTITGSVSFAANTRLIVKQGGKLIVDGGTLTRACDDNWMGIEVWGNPDTTQGFPSQQGYFVIENGGSIEYAKTGVYVGKKDLNGNAIDGYEGGIVHCTDAIFLNNNIDLEFKPYQNMHPYYPNNELANISGFKNCEFITDYSNNFYIECEAHVILRGIKDVSFYGCDFEFIYSYFNFADDKGTGILGYNSSFSVLPGCTSTIYPCPEIDSTHFNNLTYGIRAFNDGGNRIVRVEDTRFSANERALYLSGYTDPKIISSKFYCSKYPEGVLGDDMGDIAYGIYLDGCTGYHIENNEFYEVYQYGLTTISNVGIFVYNSGAESNEIYNNSFHNLKLGMAAFGENRGEETGLCITCNDFNINLNDIWIYPDTSKSRWRQLQGIAPYQGNPDDTTGLELAGNTFTFYPGNPWGQYEYNMLNDPNCEHITYVHHLRDEDPHTWPKNINDTTMITRVEKLVYFSKLTHCPSSLVEPPNLVKSKATYDSTSTNLLVAENELLALTDGGDTENLNADVLYSQSTQSLELMQQLMAESPYLSDTVLKSSIQKEEVLPNVMIRDLLVANPKAPKSDQIMVKLDERSEPMPDYMMGQIMNGLTTIGAKEKLEARRNHWDKGAYAAFNEITRLYLSDTTIVNQSDSLIAFLQSIQKPFAEYRLAMEYLKQSNFTAANNVIGSMQTTGYLEETRLSYVDYFNIMESLSASGKTISQMDSTDIDNLLAIANNNYPLISTYARNTLVVADKLDYTEPLLLPAIYKASYIDYPKVPLSGEAGKSSLRVFPVPAKDYCIVEYQLPENLKVASIQLYDINGRLLMNFEVSERKDQQFISLEKIHSGLYTICLFADGKIVGSQKINVLN
jgi:Papain family cysteine protease/Secretion system C-terminal sorting domain